MKKIFIVALLILCFAIPVFAAGITWFGNVGIGTAKDDTGFIVFKDKTGAYTYVWIDSDYAKQTNRTVRHTLMITHSAALYTAHTPDTEQGYFNISKKGINLL